MTKYDFDIKSNHWTTIKQFNIAMQKSSKKLLFGVLRKTKVIRNSILSNFNLKRPSGDEN